ncbi:MAG: hypothetical protein HY855_02700 [Burkholderiales bacterium]|nr:hypothetical protein [Burkholderiales bacterium]
MSIRLTEAELVEITDYHQPARQLEELHRLGFWRARRSLASGRIILERAHYEAVCAGETKPAGGRGGRSRPDPQLQPA